MRQFLLAGNVAYTTATALTAIAAGAVGFYYNNDGVPTVTATGSEITDKAMLVLGRTSANGGPVVLPIFKNNFSYVKGEYVAATTFVGTITVTAPTTVGEYSVIVAKKGVKFNERNKWTASVYIKDTTTTAAALATALVEQINNNSEGSGVTATASAAVITITASTAGDDYAIIGADGLTGATTAVTTVGSPAYGDAAYVQDLANKAAADAGFEYTYQDDVNLIYPKYPMNPLASADAEDTGFTIFTLRFAEPREVKTTDQAINQIVQVAFPTGATAITTFETVCKALAGVDSGTATASE